MNRVLAWPQTAIAPGLLSPLKARVSDTTVSESHTVRFDLPGGRVEMGFLSDDQRLPEGTRVQVWWKGGFFVCASIDELREEAHHQRSIARRVDAARARLEAARRERIARDSAMAEFDSMPAPLPRPEASILLGA